MNKTYGIHNSRISRFHSLPLAQRNLQSRVKMGLIIMGDDNRYWVVCPADAQRLVKAGLEYCPL